jgi:hypothetical protein
MGFEDRAHAAAADALQDVVLADLLRHGSSGREVGEAHGSGAAPTPMAPIVAAAALRHWRYDRPGVEMGHCMLRR